MNEHPPDDELVSAALDGEATPAEQRRLAGDPDLAARLAAFRRVADLVGQDVEPPEPADRERALAAALATELGHVDERAVRAAPPEARGRSVWLVAAVLALILLVPLGLAATGSLPTGNRAQDAGAPAPEHATSANDAEGAPTGADSAAGGSTAPAAESALDDDRQVEQVAPIDLGDVDDLAELADAIGPLLVEGATSSGSSTESTPPPMPPSGSACDDDPTNDALRALARYQGAAALVVVEEEGGGLARATVYRLVDCQVLGQVEL